MKILGRFNKLFLALNLIFVLLLLCSYLASYVSPQRFWFFAFCGLIYPYLLIINFSFIIFWITQLKLQLFVSLLAIIIGWSSIHKLFQYRNTKLSEQVLMNQNYFKVMSFNVRVFNLYDWKNNKEMRNNILDFIKKENPDIINFQEFYTDDGKKFLHEDTLKKMLNLPYAHIHYTANLHGKDHWGIATYTRFPVVGEGVVEFKKKSNNICIYSDIKVNEKIIRFYNMHLQSIHFGKQDYKVIDELTKNDDWDEEDIDGSKIIVARLKRAFVKRAPQADSVSASILRSPHPVIVCGDFNDSPFSYAYHTISTNLKDAFVESGSGFGPTYNGNLPPLRIDYILYSPNLEAYNFATSKVDLSDHFPVSCYFKK